jgi:hypothetical protein
MLIQPLIPDSTLAKRKSTRRRTGKSSSGLGVRRTSDGGAWVLVHPRCARERAEDLEEVRTMIEGEELDIAIDELRYLVGGCSEFVEAHCLLGVLAVETKNDVRLARGHFGVGYQLGLQTLRRAGMPGPLPYAQPANKAFFEAGRGLAWCLAKLDKLPMAREVVDTLVKLDPSDPLGLRAMLDEVQSGGLPIVDLLPGSPTEREDVDDRE